MPEGLASDVERGSAGDVPATAGAGGRQALAAAAAELLLEGGVAAVTHQAVAERAGPEAGRTTEHFADLDDLRRAAVAGAAELEHARGRRRLEGDEHRRLARCLVDVIAGLHRLEDPVLLCALYERTFEAARTPALVDAAVAWDEGVARLVGAELARHRSGVDAQRTLALVEGRLVGWLARGAPPDGDPLAAIDGDLAALAPPGGWSRR